MRRPDLESVVGVTLTGMLVGAALMSTAMACALFSPRAPAPPPPPPPEPAVAVGAPAAAALRGPSLGMPVDGVSLAAVRDTFEDRRGGHVHGALDIMAARGTPVRAAEAGRIVGLPQRGDGGIAVEETSADGRLCFYYAHLSGYARGLHAGQDVLRGDVIGYVGTTGNAPPRSPHLHFAVYRMGADKGCFSGTPVDPYPLLR